MLLHREDAYVSENPRAGEADFIIAKHRNGPTSTIPVAFKATTPFRGSRAGVVARLQGVNLTDQWAAGGRRTSAASRSTAVPRCDPL